MRTRVLHPPAPADETEGLPDDSTLPRATLQYRLQAWRSFQRALDPLAPPKPLRPPRRLH